MHMIVIVRNRELLIALCIIEMKIGRCSGRGKGNICREVQKWVIFFVVFTKLSFGWRVPRIDGDIFPDYDT